MSSNSSDEDFVNSVLASFDDTHSNISVNEICGGAGVSTHQSTLPTESESDEPAAGPGNANNVVVGQSSASASNQHKGKSRKRKQPPTCEEDGMKSEPLTVQAAMVDIDNLRRNRVYRRGCKLRDLKKSYSLIYEIINSGKEAKARNDEFLRLWEAEPVVQEFNDIISEIDKIKKECRALVGKQSSDIILPNELALRLKNVNGQLTTIMVKLIKEDKDVNELVHLVTQEDLDTETLREKLCKLRPSWFNEEDQACHDEQHNVDGDEQTNEEQIGGQQTDDDVHNEQADWGTTTLAPIDEEIAKLAGEVENSRKRMEDAGKQKKVIEECRAVLKKQFDASAKIKNEQIGVEQTDDVCNEQSDWVTNTLVPIDEEIAKLASEVENSHKTMEDAGKQKKKLEEYRAGLKRCLDARPKIMNA